MKLTVLRPVEIEADAIRVNVPVRYGTEDIPADFPFRRPWQPEDTGSVGSSRDDRWDVTVRVDTGRIINWPAGRTGEVHMKVCDGGNYTLFDGSGDAVALIFEDYVPWCVPEGADYIGMTIGPDGTVAEWAKSCTPEWVRGSFFRGGDT